jgi:WD40 repeat protein
VADVFISYSRRDAEFVRWLHASLTDAGRDVWVDWEDIPPASEWAQDIDDSIDAAESVVFVITSDSLASEYCGEELQRAGKQGKRIVPIALDGADPAAAPPDIRQRNWIWCRADDDRAAALDALARALDTDLAWSRAHTRLLVRAVEWEKRGDRSLLLRGRDLAEAERTISENAGKDPTPTELQQHYLHESRSAATRRQRILLGAVTTGLLVAAALGILALLQRNAARRATSSASSLALTSVASAQPVTHLDAALLLSLAAVHAQPTVQARSSMVDALQTARGVGVRALIRVGHGSIATVAFSRDGRTVVAGNKDGTVAVWKLGEAKATILEGHHGTVQAVATGGNGTIAAGTADGTALLWRGGGGDAVTVKSGDAAVNAIAVSPDGDTVAVGGAGGTLTRWDTRTATLRRSTSWQVVSGVAFSPDGRRLAVSDPTAGSVSVLDTHSLSSVGSFDALSNGTYGVTFARDGHTAVTAGQDGTTLWSTKTLKQIGEPLNDPRHAGVAISTPTVSADSQIVASLGTDGSIDIFDRRTRKPLSKAVLPTPLNIDARVTAIALSPTAETLAVAGANGIVVLRDLQRETTAPRRRTFAVAFDPDGRVLATGDARGEISLRDVGTGRTRSIANVPGEVEALAFGASGRSLAVAYNRRRGDSPGRVTLVDVGGGRRRTLAPFDGYTNSLALAGDGQSLAVGLDIGEVLLVDLRARKRIALPPHGGFSENVIHDAYVDRVAFSPDGQTLASMGDGTVALWSLHEHRWTVWNAHQGELDTVAFDPSGRLLATHGTRGRLRLWNTATHDLVGTLNSPAPGGTTDGGVAFSPDGRLLVTAVGRGAVRLWSLSPRAPVGPPLSTGQHSLTAVAFAADNRTFAAAGDGVALWRNVLWDDYSELRRRVCGLVIGDLTPLEWSDLVPGLPYRTVC